MSEELHNLTRFYAEKEALIAYADANAEAADLLYSLDLLPEQVEEGSKDFGRMLILTAWIRDRATVR